MDYLEYKGYKGTVEYCKEDECLVGKVIGFESLEGEIHFTH